MNTTAKQEYIVKMRNQLNARLKYMSSCHVEQTSSEPQAIDVLLIEDDVTDIKSLQEELSTAGINHNIVSVDNTDNAIKYLNRETPYSDFPVPDVIFVDMCSEKINGQQLLDFIKQEDVLKSIPTFTTFDDAVNLESTKIDGISFMCKIKKPFNKGKIKSHFESIYKLRYLIGNPKALAS